MHCSFTQGTPEKSRLFTLVSLCAVADGISAGSLLGSGVLPPLCRVVKD